MAKEVKVTQKELKQPDRFRQFVADSIIWAQGNATRIVVAFLGTGVLIAAILIMNHQKEQKELRANYELQQIVSSYQDKHTGKASEDALKGLKALRDKYSGTAIAGLSFYYSALISYDAGKYDTAIETYKKFLASDSSDERLNNAALLGVGLAYFNLEKWKESIEYLSKVNPNYNPSGTQAKLHIGLAYEKLGEPDKAKAIYKDTLGLL